MSQRSFEPDPDSYAAFFGGLGVADSPERRLVAAILGRACADIHGSLNNPYYSTSSGSGSATPPTHSLIAWFQCDGNEPGDYLWCCESIGLSDGYARDLAHKAIAAIRDGKQLALARELGSMGNGRVFLANPSAIKDQRQSKRKFDSRILR